MAEYGPRAGVDGGPRDVCSHDNGDPVLAGAGTGLVDAGSRHAPVVGERDLFVVRLVDASAGTVSQVLKTLEASHMPMEESSEPGRPINVEPDHSSSQESSAIVCPVCGAATVQEKCKVICKSEIC